MDFYYCCCCAVVDDNILKNKKEINTLREKLEISNRKLILYHHLFIDFFKRIWWIFVGTFLGVEMKMSEKNIQINFFQIKSHKAQVGN